MKHSFIRREKLNAHIQLMHLNESLGKIDESEITIKLLELSEEQIKKFIDSNFDNTCDICHIKLENLKSASSHYLIEHKTRKGYLKCCDARFRTQSLIIDHINWHINPEIFK